MHDADGRCYSETVKGTAEDPGHVLAVGCDLIHSVGQCMCLKGEAHGIIHALAMGVWNMYEPWYGT